MNTDLPRIPLVRPAPGGLDAAEWERYARQTSLPGFGVAGQLRLRAASVAIVGLGGLGGPLARVLARAGVGRVRLIDGDVVSPSNLPRQTLYLPGDVGRGKAEVAAARLTDEAPGLACEPVGERLDADNAARLLAGCDLVCDATDRFEERYVIDAAAEEAGVPVVWGALSEYQGQVSVFWARAGVTYRRLFPERPAEGLTAECLLGGVLPTASALVAMLMAQEAIKLCTGVGEPLLGRLLYVDTLTGETRRLRVADAAVERVAPVRELRAGDLTRLDAGRVTVIDVREGPDASSELPGALRYSLPEIAGGAVPRPLLEGPVLVVCETGALAREAADLLASRGAREVAVARADAAAAFVRHHRKRAGRAGC